ncbi:hypothetical protein Bca101_059791 [Brassica carinata]
MPGPKKLRLALIIIIDGVLIAHQQMPRPTLNYVRMVQNVDSFCNHPWGRESFLKTITCMKPPKFVPKRCEDPVATLVHALKQDSFRLSGFPLLLQSPAYAPSMNDILRVEADPELEVSSLIPIHSQPEPGWGVWPDVCNDDRVSYMEQRIADNYPFEKHHWHGGDTSIPIMYEETSEEENSQKLKEPQKPAPKKTIMSKPVPREALKKSLKSKPAPKDGTLSPIEEDHSPVISQYEAQLHGSTSGETTELAAQAPPVQASLVHTSSSVSPVHKTRVHSPPVHKSPPQTPPPIHNSAVQVLSTNQNGHVCTRSVIYDASAHPTSPELHHLLFHGKEIIEKISPDFPSFTQPKYDSSTNQASRRQIFPLSPLPFTPETSPNKISDSLPGFVRHASSINAFSATATSTPLSVSNPIAPHLQDHPMEDNNIVELSDNSPARERARHMPTLEEGHLVRELRNCKSVPAPDVISPLPQIQWDLFKKIITKYKAAFHITPSKFDFSNDFLLKLAKPTQWTTTYHMEILMHMLAERHSSLLEEKKLAFVSPHLTAGLQAVSKDFNKSRKREAFKWDKQVTDLVLQPGKKWMEDVFTVYTPMIWDDQHWVGLAINLDLGCVEILDPLPDLYRDKDVDRFMAPVLKTLPFLVKKVANYQLTQFRGLEPFSWHRVSGLYINERGGDCVPVSVKFLELHAHGDPENHMSRFTDKTIDDIRRQYALDIYKTIVIPAYYAPAKALSVSTLQTLSMLLCVFCEQSETNHLIPMSSSSSSSSLQGGRRSVYGIPTRCWCGQVLDTWVSETKENPYRRFYRCKIALQFKTESHLFKWVDEAILDEIRMVDAKRIDLVHDFQSLAEKTNVELHSQRDWIVGRNEEMQNEIKEKMMQLSRAIDEATRRMKEQIDAELTTHINKKLNNEGSIHKIAAVMAICGAMSYLYWKLL